MITISNLEELVKSGKDYYDIAHLLIDSEIKKHVSIGLDDLPDTATVGSELEAVVECLEQGEYKDAINIAEESAVLILEDEGFAL